MPRKDLRDDSGREGQPVNLDDVFSGMPVFTVPTLRERLETKKFSGNSDTNTERDEHE
ncbi:hypothetical protein GCM10027091_32810 [Streptomyces daliensis]